MPSLWNRSGVVERYADDLRASGAKAYFYEGGTTAPISVYGDSGEGQEIQQPVTADANGRWPDVFVPYRPFYDVRVTDAFNVQLTHTQNIPNPAPVPAAEGDTIIPADLEARLFHTGHVIGEFTNPAAVRLGWVRCNGGTINKGGFPGGTERSNNDTFALYSHLYNNVPNSICPVSPTRTGDALNDFNNGNPLQLPDMRGCSLSGMTAMGLGDAGGLFAGVMFPLEGPAPPAAGSSTLPGSLCGTNSQTMSITQMPRHGHPGTTEYGGEHYHNIIGETSTVSDDHTHAWGPYSSSTNGFSNNHVHNSGSWAFTVVAMGSHLASSAFYNAWVNAGASITFSEATANHTHTFTVGGQTSVAQGGTRNGNHIHYINFRSGPAVDEANFGNTKHQHTFTTNPVGGTEAIGGTGAEVQNNTQRSRLVTWYIKL